MRPEEGKQAEPGHALENELEVGKVAVARIVRPGLKNAAETPQCVPNERKQHHGEGDALCERMRILRDRRLPSGPALEGGQVVPQVAERPHAERHDCKRRPEPLADEIRAGRGRGGVGRSGAHEVELLPPFEAATISFKKVEHVAAHVEQPPFDAESVVLLTARSMDFEPNAGGPAGAGGARQSVTSLRGAIRARKRGSKRARRDRRRWRRCTAVPPPFQAMSARPSSFLAPAAHRGLGFARRLARSDGVALVPLLLPVASAISVLMSPFLR